MNEQTTREDEGQKVCEGGEHRWPEDHQEGDTCNCGAFYLIANRGFLIIAEPSR